MKMNRMSVLVSAGAIALVALIVGMLFGFPAYSRYQKRANAKNQVQVNHIIIQQQAQRVFITKQEANIRYQQSIGIRRAQDEIRSTLTPLYVQFELVQALQAIATSGSNDTVIYLPTDPKNGLPVVPTSNTTTPSVPKK